MIEEKPTNEPKDNRGASTPERVEPVSSQQPVPSGNPQQNLSPNPSEKPTNGKIESAKKVLVEIVKDEELKPFERKTLRLAWIGFIVAILTGIVFFLQFREMQTQTGILNSQAQQAAKDAIEATKRVEQQLSIAQAQADAAKAQGQIMRQQLDLSERPWIVSEFAPTYFLFKEDGGFLGLRITLTNIGHSTAESITAWTTLSVNERTYVSEGETNCGYPKLPVNKNYRGGSVLFPGQQFTFEQPAVARKEAIEKALTGGDFKDLHMLPIHVLTCIDYRSTLDSRHHQTRKFFTLVRPDPITRGMMGVFDPHGNYELSSFKMLPGGWDQAD